MKLSTLSLSWIAVLGAALLAAGCAKPAPGKPAPVGTTTKAGEGPKVMEQVEPMPALAPVPAGETRYIAHIHTTDGKPLAGVMTMLLSEIPEDLYMREPRRAMVISQYKSPSHGRVTHQVQNDGKPKYLWCGRQGVQPFTIALEPSSGGQFERTVPVTVSPVATFVIEDHQGMRVANAIVTMKLADGLPESTRPGLKENYGTTERSDDLGEVKFTRPVGKYTFIASKENGTCRLTTTVDWNGSPEPVKMRLPEKTPPSQ